MRVERLVETRINPLKAMQVVDIPDIAKSNGVTGMKNKGNRRANKEVRIGSEQMASPRQFTRLTGPRANAIFLPSSSGYILRRVKTL